MAAVNWGGETVVVVDLAHIGAVPMTSTAPQLAMVSLNTVVERDVRSCLLPWAGLRAGELLSCSEAGYGVQSMGRLRSDFKEFCEALEDMGDVDGSLSS
jgi:hypothetical protein